MWKVLIFASLLGAGSAAVPVLDAGVTGVADAAEASADGGVPTEANVRTPAGLNAARDAEANMRDEERRAAILKVRME